MKHGYQLIAGIVTALLLVCLLVVYPLAQKRGEIGMGSDADDALKLACSRLIQGKHPYTERTYLGNKITPMPGWIWLNAPIVLLCGPEWLVMFWWLAGKKTPATMIFLLISARTICTGADYAANALALLWCLENGKPL